MSNDFIKDKMGTRKEEPSGFHPETLASRWKRAGVSFRQSAKDESKQFYEPNADGQCSEQGQLISNREAATSWV